MHLETPKTPVNKNQKDLYEFLTHVENFEKIMPEHIQKFETTGAESFIFQLKGMPEIRLKIQEKTPYDQVILGSGSEKFPFTLKAAIEEITEEKSNVQLLFDGEFNSMMAMMVKSPLKKFIHTLIKNMAKLKKNDS